MKFLTKLIKRVILSLLNQRTKFFLRNLKKKYSAFSAYLRIKKYVNFDNGFIIECGANDGITNSNSYYLEKNRNWKSLLIEPSEKFKELILIRNKRSHNYNNAATSFKNENKYINFIYLGLMTTAMDKNIQTDISDTKKFVEFGKRHLKNHREKSHTFTVKGKSLTSMLDEIKAPSTIDFFSLDTEGMTIEVLEGIDFKKYIFKYILVEAYNFDKVSNYLLTRDYKFIEKIQFDYIFSHKNFCK